MRLKIVTDLNNPFSFVTEKHNFLSLWYLNQLFLFLPLALGKVRGHEVTLFIPAATLATKPGGILIKNTTARS